MPKRTDRLLASSWYHSERNQLRIVPHSHQLEHADGEAFYQFRKEMQSLAIYPPHSSFLLEYCEYSITEYGMVQSHSKGSDGEIDEFHDTWEIHNEEKFMLFLLTFG